LEPLLIEIKQDRADFDHFTGAWVCKGGLNIVIDVGPSNSVPRLIHSLRAMGIERIDYVLISHIHLDHAGGLAEFLEQFPMALAVCHHKGLSHLVEPSRLWQGSLNVLGDLAESYGAPRPVNPKNLLSHSEAKIGGLEIIETPGHAPHHLSFIYGEHLFVGEAGGNYFHIDDSDYLRPATPPIFRLEKALSSIDLLLERERLPICYSHFGMAQDSHRMLRRSREQLLLWKEIIAEERERGNQSLDERCVRDLLDRDPNLRAWSRMPAPVQERERWFLRNSVKGYIGYLRSLGN